MQKNSKICFYSDSSEWGGHESLSVRIANALASDGFHVLFIYANSKFKTVLHKDIKGIPLDFTSKNPFPILRDSFSFNYLKVCRHLQLEKADYLVICQGNIERCIAGVKAAKKLRIPLISYYPMGYTQTESGAVMGRFRDALAKFIYPKIDQWIVLSDYQCGLVKRFINKLTPIHIIPIPLTWDLNTKAKQPNTCATLACIGRLYFGHKGQNIIPPAIKLVSSNFVKQVRIIGKGPHYEKLINIINSNHVENVVSVENWIEPEQIQATLINHIDILLITSHFEGGPTIIFEAFECGIPVLVANVGYVKDYALPDWMLFEENNVNDLVNKITNYNQAWNVKEFNEVREKLFANRTDAQFRKIVIDVFTKICY